MNKDQRWAFLGFHRYTCAVTGRSFGGNYPMIEKNLSETGRMTVHHAYPEDRTQEGFDKLAPLYAEAHWQVDNASKEGQISYLKRELAGLRARDGQRRRPIIERALHFIEQKDTQGETFDLAVYLKLWAAPFAGQETPAYLAALEQEQTVDRPKRKAERKKARKASRKARKAWGERTGVAEKVKKMRRRKKPVPQQHSGKEPEAIHVKHSRLSSKTLAQLARPVLNGI